MIFLQFLLPPFLINIQLGINYFDTSPYYQLTKSETVLGKALKGIERSKYILSTKVGRYGFDDFNFNGDYIKEKFNESLNRLGVDYVDICICHDIEFTDLDKVINETIPALKQLKEEGKIRYIGVSGLPLYIFKYILERSNDIDLILSYCHYNLIDTTLYDLYQIIKDYNIGIISASPLSMGLLTNQGEPDWHPAPEILKKKCREVAEYCKSQGENISHLAVYFSTRAEFVTTTLVGMPTRESLKENINALLSKQVNEKVLNNVIEMFKDVKNMTWESGRIENNKPIKDE